MSAIIDGFVIDVAKVETHVYPAEVTEHPVEAGSDVVDHVRNLPIVVTIEGVVSDTPIGNVAGLRAADSLPSDDALAHLQNIRAAREPITIETSLETFRNMVMINLEVPRRATLGDALHFTAAFKQIEFVTNNRTTIPVEVPRAANKQNRGNRPSNLTQDTGGSAQNAAQKTKDSRTGFQQLLAGDAPTNIFNL